MTDTGFFLTRDEMSLVQNQEWLLSKHRIIAKVYDLFGGLSDEYRLVTNRLSNLLPQEVLVPSPKIYRGEQYRQLPYVLLDYPRCFQKQQAFAIRTMFWWGHYFSIHLVLSGRYKDHYAKCVFESIAKNGWHIGINADPWQHHFEQDNYVLIRESKIDPEKWTDQTYFKLAAMHPLDQWSSAQEFFIERYQQLLEACRC
jgi:hypothetical protein